MKKQTKAIVAIGLLVAMLPLMLVPASANSALTEWGGKDANGIVTTSKECPIIVEHETLTFNINELPSPDRDAVADDGPIDSTVTAEYTFYNPSDAEITAKLAFPFSILKSTGYDITDERYSITVNGETIESEIRHTLYTKYYSGYEFDVDVDLPRLLDDYVKDDYFNDDLTITKYTVLLETSDDGAYNWVLDISADKYPNSVFYIPGASSTTKQEEGVISVEGIMNCTSKTIDVYVLGEANGISQFKFYTHSWTFDGEVHGGEVVEGVTKIDNSETVSFTDFIFANYDEASGISRMDWYNATVLRLKETNRENSYIGFARFGKDYQDKFMCWYYYDITIGAGERIVNSVTAPMLPGTSIRYNPPVYDYTYLISPAATWRSFGDLDIIINTPYYMTYSNIDGFEKTENGYALHLDGLPKEKDKYKLTLGGIVKEEGKVKDLIFKLSESEDPESKSQFTPLQTALIIIAVIVFLPLIIVALIIYGVLMLVRKITN